MSSLSYTRKLQDQHGQDRYSTEVVVNVNGSMQMLGSRQQSGSSPSQHQGWGQPQQPASLTRQRICLLSLRSLLPALPGKHSARGNTPRRIMLTGFHPR